MKGDAAIRVAQSGCVKTVRCSCGYIASGRTAVELLRGLEAHIDATHARPVRDAGDKPVSRIGARGRTRHKGEKQ
jgi:hypothetical protein